MMCFFFFVQMKSSIGVRFYITISSTSHTDLIKYFALFKKNILRRNKSIYFTILLRYSVLNARKVQTFLFVKGFCSVPLSPILDTRTSRLFFIESYFCFDWISFYCSDHSAISQYKTQTMAREQMGRTISIQFNDII